MVNKRIIMSEFTHRVTEFKNKINYLKCKYNDLKISYDFKILENLIKYHSLKYFSIKLTHSSYPGL